MTVADLERADADPGASAPAVPPRTRASGRNRVVVAVALWAVLLVVARLVGLAYVAAHDTELSVNAVPFFGRWNAYLSWRLAAPVAVGVVGVVAGPVVAERARWRWVLLGVAVLTAAFGLALAWSSPVGDGWRTIQVDFGRFTHLVDQQGPGGFLSSYVHRQPHLGGHLRSHGPGLVLLLWALEQVGASGTGWQLGLVVGATATAAVAAVLACRDVVGDRAARAAAPFVAIAPAAVWHTNPDCLYAGLAVPAVALVILATGRTGRRSDALALGGGLLFAATLSMTYGVTLLVVPALAVGVWRRAWRPLAIAALGAGAVLLALAAWGYWWPAGLLETRVQYRHSISRVRGYKYWLLGNLAVFATLVGPATAAGLARLRGRGAWVLVGSALAVVLVADLSGLTSAETERIWQPFVPLVLLAALALWDPRGSVGAAGRRAARGWLAAQGALAVGLQILLRTPW